MLTWSCLVNSWSVIPVSSNDKPIEINLEDLAVDLKKMMVTCGQTRGGGKKLRGRRTQRERW